MLTNADIFNIAVWSMKSFDSRITYALMNGIRIIYICLRLEYQIISLTNVKNSVSRSRDLQGLKNIAFPSDCKSAIFAFFVLHGYNLVLYHVTTDFPINNMLETIILPPWR